MSIVSYLSNSIGWSTNRKLLVIESDDWGSIRMPSNQVRDNLESNSVDLGNGLESYRYSLFDTLAGEDDFQALYELLRKYKDINNYNPVFTAMSLVANPDFDKIKVSGFEKYYYEPFNETLNRYGKDKAFNLWESGYKEHLFVPEFHGREHLNVAAWMRNLRKEEKKTTLAFENGMWAVNVDGLPIDYQAAFDLEIPDDLNKQHKIVSSGLELFEKIFGRKARFFVPPNGPINNKLLSTASDKGVDFVSSAKIQREVFGYGKSKVRFHWLGKKNRYNQRLVTRNCFFEPSDKSKDWVDSCLSQMELAFKLNKPAVISSHRVNYVGGLDEANRKHGLTELDRLLKTALTKWPDVEFITSVQLGDIILGK